MHKEDGLMQLTHTNGLMPSEQQMTVGTTHQPMNMTYVQCPDYVQVAVCQQFRINTILVAQHMS